MVACSKNYNVACLYQTVEMFVDMFICLDTMLMFYRRTEMVNSIRLCTLLHDQDQY